MWLDWRFKKKAYLYTRMSNHHVWRYKFQFRFWLEHYDWRLRVTLIRLNKVDNACLFKIVNTVFNTIKHSWYSLLVQKWIHSACSKLMAALILSRRNVVHEHAHTHTLHGKGEGGQIQILRLPEKKERLSENNVEMLMLDGYIFSCMFPIINLNADICILSIWKL